MGHGDDLILCDTNFPANSVARQTVLGRLLRIDNVSAGSCRTRRPVGPAAQLLCRRRPRLRMEIVGKPDEVPPVQSEVQAEVDAAEGRPWPMGGVERFAFYDLAKKAYCVIQTGERRFYGCFAFKKGVIAPGLSLADACAIIFAIGSSSAHLRADLRPRFHRWIR